MTDLVKLAERVEALEAALRPFAEAARRIDHFDGEDFDAPLLAFNYADAMRELLNGIQGEPVTVAHLRMARAAMETTDDK